MSIVSEIEKNNKNRIATTPVDFVNNSKTRVTWLVDIIVSSCMETTTHGIIPILKRENFFIRFFWTVCLLVSTGVCAYMVALSIIGYFDYDTVTKVEKISLISTDFPAVTICNKNAFMTEASLQFMDEIMLKYNVTDMNNLSAFYDSLNATGISDYKYLTVMNALDPNRTDEFRRSLGYSISDMMLTCMFGYAGCVPDDFHWYYNIFFGNCYTFNSGKYTNNTKAPTRKSSRSGPYNGLVIELFIYEPINMTSMATSSGLNIIVHNQSEKVIFDRGVSVSSGTHTYVQINRRFSYRLENPYSDCTENIDESYPSEMVQYVLKNDSPYTQLDCFFACYQIKTVEECGCYDNTILFPFEIFTAQNIRPCLSLTQMNCFSEVYYNFFRSAVPQSCRDKCPLECDTITYDLYLSSVEYPSLVYGEALMKNPWIKYKYAKDISKLNYDSLKRSMVQISVFYGDISYDHLDESAKTEVIDLVSNIGGTLGLFLGMSFLSFAEIFDILLQLLFYKNKPKNLVMP